MQVTLIRTEIFINNKVGVPESTGVIIIEYQGQTMIATGNPVLSINGINFYWFKPTHLPNIIQIPQENELNKLKEEICEIRNGLSQVRQDLSDKHS